MFGDQWVCRCGAHNFILREKCRECFAEKEESVVREESWVEVMDNVIAENKKTKEAQQK